MDYLKRPYAVAENSDETIVTAAKVGDALAADADVTDVFVVHCETTTGIMNPLPEICAAVKAKGRGLIVDAMSSFGAIPIDVQELDIDVLGGLRRTSASKAFQASAT